MNDLDDVWRQHSLNVQPSSAFILPMLRPFYFTAVRHGRSINTRHDLESVSPHAGNVNPDTNPNLSLTVIYCFLIDMDRS